ncbi:exo-alpha-sialidase [Longitalea luteola]|uniref:exo-alpha-sialidase n=1 Tax=Longitalea luteola TaxID=2812563 RepID=UPI001A96ACB4|nr:exo-alpha-sialidase [Longitalea luteola]
MKKLYFLFLIGAAAWGCGDKDRFMITSIPTEPVINANIKVLIKDNSLLHVRLDSNAGIRGITTNNYFQTTDQFKNFTYNAYSLPNTKITPFSYNGNTITVASGTDLAPVVHFSKDHGTTWSSVAPVAFSPAINTTGFYATELVYASYINSNYVMLAYQQKAETTADSRKFYKLDLTSQEAIRISYFDDAFQPVNIQFADDSTGYMLLYKNSSYSTFISKTRDTGRTWSEPKAIDNRVITGLQLGNKGNICAIEEFGNVYISPDSGKTWKKPAADLKLTFAHMVNQHIVYGLTKESLMKSTDTGVTWNTVSNEGYEYLNMKKLHFQDDQNGLMYGDQKLYLTADGGMTWKTLLYPYSYVVE